MAVDRSNVLLQGIVGSTAYGLAREGSDIDQLAIYCAPMDALLGLKATASFDDPAGPHPLDDTLVSHEPDYTVHEVGKYVKLALGANPTILELMWLPEYVIKTRLGEWLINNRTIFLSTGTVKGRYGGYAKAQAERLFRRHEDDKEGFSSDVKQRTAKHGRHCTRLLLQGAQLLRTGTMSVKVDQDDREYIFAQGELAERDPQGFYDEAMKQLADFDNIESVLNDKPDYERADLLLRELRWEAHVS